jgi:hypothetical protein
MASTQLCTCLAYSLLLASQEACGCTPTEQATMDLHGVSVWL